MTEYADDWDDEEHRMLECTFKPNPFLPKRCGYRLTDTQVVLMRSRQCPRCGESIDRFYVLV